MGSDDWRAKQEKWVRFREEGHAQSGYGRWLWRRTSVEAKRLVEAALLERQGLVVDVGTDHLGFFDYLDVKPVRYVAVDPAPQETEKDRSVASLVHGVAEELPFDDGSVRVLCFRSSMDHFQSAPRAMAEARRVLEPGGVLLIVLSNRRSLLRGLRLARDRLRGSPPYDHLQEHMYWYTAESIATLCVTAGFHLREQLGIGFVPIARGGSGRRERWLEAVESVLHNAAPQLGDVLLVTAEAPR